MVIVDTTVWVDYLNGTLSPAARWLDRELGQQEIGLTDLILCETLQGIQSDQEFARVKVLLSEFELFVMGGEELCVAAAQNYRRLRQRGRTVRKTIDCLIATYCLKEGHSLLHRDRDYDHFEQELGLKVIHP